MILNRNAYSGVDLKPSFLSVEHYNIFSLFLFIYLLSACNSQEKNGPITAQPIENKAQWWQDRHKQILEADKSGVKIVFIGDSITQRWDDSGKSAWFQTFGSKLAFNMGFSGDRTQNVLWRIENGELDNISPNIVFLLIGTNNANSDSAEDIAIGIKANIDAILKKLPDSKLAVYRIFPRDVFGSSLRRITQKASDLVIMEVNQKNLFHIDINDSFLDDSGEIPTNLMADGLHLTSEGYDIWAHEASFFINNLE